MSAPLPFGQQPKESEARRNVGRCIKISVCSRDGEWLWHLVAMTLNATIPKIHYRRRFYHGENGEVYWNASGETSFAFSRIYAPSPEAIRLMLLRIRQRQNWSQAHLAAVLGIPRNTLRRWEDQSRQPCSSARKLVFFVHALVFTPKELLAGLDHIVTWGKAGGNEMLILNEESGQSRPMHKSCQE